MTHANVYFASLTGNNLEVAEFVAQQLRQAGMATNLSELMQVELADLFETDLLIIVPYTYGAGDLPEEGLDLYKELSAAHLPNLVYGVAGSGDVYYGADFCRAVSLFDDRLNATGAQRGAEKVFIDLRLDEADHQRLKQFCQELVSRTKQASK